MSLDDLAENREALLSKPFVKRIAKARRDMKVNKGTSLDSLAKGYGV